MKKVAYVFNSILNDSFEDVFLKWGGNEFQRDGPARAKTRSPKTCYMQGQPENRSQQNEVSEQGCIHWLTTTCIAGRTLYTMKNRK